MIDVVSAHKAVHGRLEDLGWTTNVTGANYVRKGHTLEFKMGTMFGELTLHVRQGRVVTETYRILNEEQLEKLLSYIEDLAHESEVESMMGAND
jgi:hypothetical protein